MIHNTFTDVTTPALISLLPSLGYAGASRYVLLWWEQAAGEPAWVDNLCGSPEGNLSRAVWAELQRSVGGFDLARQVLVWDRQDEKGWISTRENGVRFLRGHWGFFVTSRKDIGAWARRMAAVFPHIHSHMAVLGAVRTVEYAYSQFRQQMLCELPADLLKLAGEARRTQSLTALAERLQQIAVDY